MSNEPDKPATPAATPAPPAAKTSKIVLLLLILNLGASGFGVFRLMTASPAAAAASHGHDGNGEDGDKKKEEVGAAITGPVLALDPFVVNLNEPSSSRYMRVNIQVETASPQAQEVVKKSLLLVRDVILSHLSGLRLQDTLGAEAKERIRLELLAKLGAKIGAEKIRRILFQEFVIQ